MGDKSLVVKVLDMPAAAYGSLKRLTLDGGDAGGLEQAMVGGRLGGLEELITGQLPAGAGILAALRDGACPRLRWLDLSCRDEGGVVGSTLARALESGHLTNLTSLDISLTSMGVGGGSSGGQSPPRRELPPIDQALVLEHGYN